MDHTRSYKSDYVYGDDTTEDEFIDILIYLTGKIPLPFDVLKQIDYQTLEPISSEKQWNTSISDRQIITGIDIEKIVTMTHK